MIVALFVVNHALGASFDEKLDTLLSHDVKLTQEREYIEYYQALKYTGYSRFLPSLSLNSAQTNQRLETGEDIERRRNSVDLSLDILSFGQDYYLALQSQKRLQAQKNKFEAQLLASQTSLAELLFNYIEKRKAIEIRQEIIALKTRSLTIAKKRYDDGKLALQEVQKVQIDLNNTQALLEADRIELRRFVSTLSYYGPVEDLEVQWPWQEKILQIESIAKSEFEITSHPTYQVDQLTLESLKMQKKSSISAMLGRLNITYSKGEVEFLDRDFDYTDESVILSFNIPLFNNFQHFADYKKAVADQYVGAAQFKNTQRFLKTSLEASSANLQSALATYKLRMQTLELSTQLFNHTLRQFQNGRISVNDLILDQDRLLQTQLLANSGAATLHNAVANFCSAVGKSIQDACWQSIE